MGNRCVVLQPRSSGATSALPTFTTARVQSGSATVGIRVRQISRRKHGAGRSNVRTPPDNVKPYGRGTGFRSLDDIHSNAELGYNIALLLIAAYR
jgi:ABC-2 type transport system ATP-binding protein